MLRVRSARYLLVNPANNIVFWKGVSAAPRSCFTALYRQGEMADSSSCEPVVVGRRAGISVVQTRGLIASPSACGCGPPALVVTCECRSCPGVAGGCSLSVARGPQQVQGLTACSML